MKIDNFRKLVMMGSTIDHVTTQLVVLKTAIRDEMETPTTEEHWKLIHQANTVEQAEKLIESAFTILDGMTRGVQR